MRTQLGAMIRYEMRMQWRRRGLPVALLALLIGLLLMSLWQRNMIQDVYEQWPAQIAGLELARRGSATYLILMSGWPVAAILLILSLPLIVSETIPKDSQVQVRELLRSLPLGSGVYLAGKVLSVWAGLLGGLALSGLCAAVAYRWLYGSYDLGLFLVLWAGLVIPLALFVSGLSILLSSTQPTRRRGTLVGVVLAAWFLFTFFAPLNTWASTLLGPSRFMLILLPLEDLMRRVVSGLLAICGSQSGLPCPEGIPQNSSFLPGVSLSPGYVPAAIAAGMLQVLVVWLAVWAWHRWRER